MIVNTNVALQVMKHHSRPRKTILHVILKCLIEWCGRNSGILEFRYCPPSEDPDHKTNPWDVKTKGLHLGCIFHVPTSRTFFGG